MSQIRLKYDFKKLKTEEPKEYLHKVDVRQLYNAESAQVMHISLQPGETLKPHIKHGSILMQNQKFSIMITID